MSGYPTPDQVESASAEALQRWVRYLPSPTDEQRPTMERILARYSELDADARVAASKRVGW